MLRIIANVTCLAFAVAFAGCSEGILKPGDVALPMTGLYRLESRTFTAQDSAGTLLSLLVPPAVRSRLVLNADGRYGQVDTTETTSGAVVTKETGRWSVIEDDFYLESDTDRFAVEKYTFDQVRLVRTLRDLPSANGFFQIVDVWRR